MTNLEKAAEEFRFDGRGLTPMQQDIFIAGAKYEQERVKVLITFIESLSLRELDMQNVLQREQVLKVYKEGE